MPPKPQVVQKPSQQPASSKPVQQATAQKPVQQQPAQKPAQQQPVQKPAQQQAVQKPAIAVQKPQVAQQKVATINQKPQPQALQKGPINKQEEERKKKEEQEKKQKEEQERKQKEEEERKEAEKKQKEEQEKKQKEEEERKKQEEEERLKKEEEDRKKKEEEEKRKKEEEEFLKAKQEEEKRQKEEFEKRKNGKIHIRTNTGGPTSTVDFVIKDGKVNYALVDDELALEYAYEKGYQFYLTAEKNGKPDESIQFFSQGSGKSRYFENLQTGTFYWCVVNKNEEAEAKRKVYKADFSVFGGKEDKPRGEGCSCLYGNPCQDKYICQDWDNRFIVAKNNLKKK